MFAIALAVLTTSLAALAPLPIRGLHLGSPAPNEIPAFTAFIRDALPKEGVNTLVVEFDYHYAFTSHPEIAEDPLSRDQVKEIVAACKDAHVRLIPQINLLGHQSWAGTTFSLLTKHPEFDETPGKYPGNKDIYCRSYCPLHPGVHQVVFDLVDELADACQADAVHVGMDEVFILADKDCPRCHGKNTAQLFADEVTKIHDHLKATHREMWMWADRFLNGTDTGLGEWEASTNGTESAIHKIPKDIVMCDWHYDHAEPTAAYFALNGLPVVSSPWRKSDVALGQLALIDNVRAGANPQIAGNLRGMLHTTWCGVVPFIDAYYGKGTPGKEAKESAQCFKDLFAAMRKG